MFRSLSPDKEASQLLQCVYPQVHSTLNIMMEGPDPIYAEEDQATHAAAVFNLGDGERIVARMQVNSAEYGGRQLSSSTQVPGLLSQSVGPVTF